MVLVNLRTTTSNTDTISPKKSGLKVLRRPFDSGDKKVDGRVSYSSVSIAEARKIAPANCAIDTTTGHDQNYVKRGAGLGCIIACPS